jgi:RNA polymerase sigma-70 factor (ECF subfamily)
MDSIERCLAGEEGAFEALYQQYARLVYHTAYLMLDNPQDADDVLQEVFIRVFRYLDTYDPARGAFTTWLHRITTNVCLRHLDRSPAPSIPLPESLGHSTREAVDAQIDARQRVRQMLSGLAPPFRVVVVLRFYGALSYQEIAGVLDVPLGTVQSRLSRALRQLRQEEEVEL